MKIASIVGARPQFIKLAPLSRELRKKHQEVLIDTGQHYDEEMAASFYSELNIPKPDYSLGIGSGNHGEQTGKMLIELEKVLRSVNPSLAIVFGDTNSTMAGAVIANRLGIPVGHVEAGLRSFDRGMPEEINRIIADHVSRLLFCPTDVAKENLEREGITEGVHVTGDVMLDALISSKDAAEKHSKIIDHLKIKKKEYQLLTCHRQSNTDIEDNLKNIINAIGESEIQTVFPIHPRTMKFLKHYGLENSIPSNIIQTKPLGHSDTIWLAANSIRVLTDSGGLQKEAYILGVPCITLRDNTEWVETIKAGWNILVGADKKRILDAINTFVPTDSRPELFGLPGASFRIAELIDKYLIEK